MMGIFYSRVNLKSSSAFTLIELLITIGILAVLATVTTLVINPAQIFAQGRDGRRVSDLDGLRRTLALAELQGISLSTSSVISVSIPDTSGTCANLGLPTLPSGWTYRCVTAANLRNVDGTGWIPVNLTQLSTGAPLSSLPVDPINTTSTSQYYTYAPGGSFELTSRFESEKYAEQAAGDGGADAAMYETGTNLSLTPFAHGLVGYWKFDEGSGTSAADSSGSGHTGTLTNGPTWTSGQFGGALSFDGVNDYVNVIDADDIDFGSSDITVSLWFLNSQDAMIDYFNKSNAAFNGNGIGFELRSQGPTIEFCRNGGTGVCPRIANSYAAGTWHHIVATVDKTSGAAILYLDGVVTDTDTFLTTAYTDTYNLTIGAGAYGYAIGKIDDVRLYRRVLPAAEVTALYNATR